MKEKNITVLVVEPGKEPYEKEIENKLESFQELVDGWIQAVYAFDDPVILVCNDEGKIDGKCKPNRHVVTNVLNDIIFGTFFIVGDGNEDFCSLKSEYVEKYKRIFKIDPFVIINVQGGKEDE